MHSEKTIPSMRRMTPYLVTVGVGFPSATAPISTEDIKEKSVEFDTPVRIFDTDDDNPSV
ncbi:MAG: hypothetical protein V7676_02520 [Parasphingorhabdus sp.]|uniref:hypothetical protein n=1 Tax=Parasphingorhabdus sp. TaxID=2709688 RepID=UPI00300188AC